jgi:hypothetical protein
MEIEPGIISLSQRKGGFVHAYLIAQDDQLLLIDSLFDTNARIILDEIERMGRSIQDL